MEREGADFSDVLADAQKLGYAEANPGLDIDGFDTAHKTAILASLAYGEWFGMDPLYVEGIRDIDTRDLRYARELGYRIKLLAIIKNDNGEIEVRVHPTLIPADSMLGNISEVFNGVMIDGDFVDKTLFYGRGAGRRATASAVVADIADAALNYAADCRQRIPGFRQGALFKKIRPMAETSSRFYIRLALEDRPGVVASIANILAQHQISLSSVIQHESSGGDSVPAVLLTHPAVEKEVQSALEEIGKLDSCKAPVVMMRIEDL
jgi:homoserine dehydrogenase